MNTESIREIVTCRFCRDRTLNLWVQDWDRDDEEYGERLQYIREVWNRERFKIKYEIASREDRHWKKLRKGDRRDTKVIGLEPFHGLS